MSIHVNLERCSENLRTQPFNQPLQLQTSWNHGKSLLPIHLTKKIVLMKQISPNICKTNIWLKFCESLLLYAFIASIAFMFPQATSKYFRLLGDLQLMGSVVQLWPGDPWFNWFQKREAWDFGKLRLVKNGTTQIPNDQERLFNKWIIFWVHVFSLPVSKPSIEPQPLELSFRVSFVLF